VTSPHPAPPIPISEYRHGGLPYFGALLLCTFSAGLVALMVGIAIGLVLAGGGR
jgi:hypothetical protein